MSTSTSTGDPSGAQTNGHQTTGRKPLTAAEKAARQKKRLATLAANKAIAAKIPPPEPVLAAQRIGGTAVAGSTSPVPIQARLPIVVATSVTLIAREAELVTERAIIDGRLAEVRKMIGMARPRVPTAPKATGRKKAKAKAKTSIANAA